MPKTRRKRKQLKIPNYSDSSRSYSHDTPRSLRSCLPRRKANSCNNEQGVPSSPIRLFDSKLFEINSFLTQSRSSLDDYLTILWDFGIRNKKKSQIKKENHEGPELPGISYTKKEGKVETVFQEEFVRGNCVPDLLYESPPKPTAGAFSRIIKGTTDCEYCFSYSRTCVCPNFIFSSPNKLSVALAACESLLQLPTETQETQKPLSGPQSTKKKKAKKRKYYKRKEKFVVKLKFEDNSFLKVLKLSSSSQIYKLLAFQKIRTLDRMKSNGKYQFEEYPERYPIKKHKQFAHRHSLSDISRYLKLELFSPQLVKELLDIILDMFVTLHSPGFPQTSIFDEITPSIARIFVQELLPYIQIYIPSMTYETLHIIIRSSYDRNRLAYSRRKKRKQSRPSEIEIKKE